MIASPLDEIEQDRLDAISTAVADWADWMHGISPDQRRQRMPSVASGMAGALSNYMASEDDRTAAYDRLREWQMAAIDASIDSLRKPAPRLYWAILQRHRLSTYFVVTWPKADAFVAYRVALDELGKVFERRGVIFA